MTIGRNTFIYPGLTLYIMYPSCWPFKIIRDTVFKHCWSHSANMVSHVSFDRRMPKNTVGSPWPSPNGPGHKPKDVAHDQQNWAGSVVDLETEKKDYGWLANPMSQTSMFGGLPMLFFGLSMAFHGFPWLSMAFHGFPWLSIAFHGFPTLWRFSDKPIHFWKEDCLSDTIESQGGFRTGRYP